VTRKQVVFVLCESNDPEDWNILGVFSTKALAEKFQRKTKSYQESTRWIEEWIVDKETPKEPGEPRKPFKKHDC
jgi:hypothetical protein